MQKTLLISNELDKIGENGDSPSRNQWWLHDRVSYINEWMDRRIKRDPTKDWKMDEIGKNGDGSSRKQW